MSGFRKAQKSNKKIKMSIQGASGSGKTYSALRIMTALVEKTDPGKRIAFIDTEKSAELYSPPFDFDVDDDFGASEKLSYNPDKLIEKLEAARKAGIFGGVIVDSATHFWKEQGGMLSMIDAVVAAMKAKGNKPDSFAAWKSVDPIYRKLMNYIRQYPLHIVLCIRAKQAYEKVEGANGRGSVKKVGVEPEFREGFEFEMDAQFAVDENHTMVALKHRLGEFLDGKVFQKPGENVAEVIEAWLLDGAPGQDATLPAETNILPSADPPPAEEPTVLNITMSLLAQIEAAATEADLKAAGDKIKVAYENKQITLDDRNKILSPAYLKRSKELKAAA